MSTAEVVPLPGPGPGPGALVIQPVFHEDRDLWVWDDGEVLYQARTRRQLRSLIREGEGREVEVVGLRWSAGGQARKRPFDVVLDLWQTGLRVSVIAQRTGLRARNIYSMIHYARHRIEDDRAVLRNRRLSDTRVRSARQRTPEEMQQALAVRAERGTT